MITDPEMAAEIAAMTKTFKELSYTLESKIKDVTDIGADMFATAASAAAPRGDKIHKRYSTAKASNVTKAPKGMGKVVATYYPGNLARSIRNLGHLKRAKNASIVGPKVGGRGVFFMNKADGYYMRMVEGGTSNWQGKPFFLASWERSKPAVTSVMVAAFKAIVAQFELANSIAP